MMRAPYSTVRLWPVVLILACVIPLEAEAASRLSVLPADGGSSVRFSQAEVANGLPKEVRVRISGDGGQYQVTHRLVDELTDNAGSRVDRSALTLTALAGSNAQGTLYIQSPQPLAYADELLYTSTPTGGSDAFTLVYQVDPAALGKGGRYFGRVLFTLRSLEGGGTDDVLLDLLLDAPERVIMELTSPSAAGLISIDSSRPDEVGELAFRTSGLAVGSGRVIQEAVTYPQSEDFEFLDEEAVLMQVSGEGSLVPTPEPLSRRPTQIFEPSEREQEWSVVFRADPERLARQKPGTYRGMFRYTLTQGGEVFAVEEARMEARIAPEFFLKIDYPPEGMNFRGVLPGGPPQERVVNVTVESNLGRPYAVTQVVNQPLSSQDGALFDTRYFRQSVRVTDGAEGRPGFDDFRPVSDGETVLYRSNNAGAPGAFRVIFRLHPHSGMAPGDYMAGVLFSLGEL